MPHSDQPVSKRYIAVLCAIAGGVLVAGVLLRPTSVPVPVRSETEILRLQLLAQKGDLQRRTLFYQSRAADLVARVAPVRTNPSQFLYRSPPAGQILLLVGTDASGEVVWATGSAAGVISTTCEGRKVPEIGTTINIPATLEAAVAFDLDDNLAGLVVPCEDRLILTTPAGFQAARQQTLEQQLIACCGLRVSDSGFRITELQRGTALARAGMQVGDRLVAINGEPVDSPERLRAFLADGPIELRVDRAGRAVRIAVPGAVQAAGATVRPAGTALEVIRVEAGAQAATAGLRAGDLVVRVDGGRPTAAGLTAALEKQTGAVVVQRGERQVLIEGAR